ncbi:MAG: hypothetical protein AAB538_04900, partial [Patescibacteria group bacterium]
MKRLILSIVVITAALAVFALLRWPLPPERENLQNLTRASVTINLSGEFEPKTTGGILSWLGIRGPSAQRRPEVGTKFASVTTTGFASSPYQTDASPCRTASGEWVRPGTLAANFLPLGTLVKIFMDGVEIPGLFIVEDRTADKFGNRVDIWFAQTSQALDFGKRKVEIVVVGYGKPGQALAQVSEDEESIQETE